MEHVYPADMRFAEVHGDAVDQHALPFDQVGSIEPLECGTA